MGDHIFCGSFFFEEKGFIKKYHCNLSKGVKDVMKTLQKNYLLPNVYRSDLKVSSEIYTILLTILYEDVEDKNLVGQLREWYNSSSDSHIQRSDRKKILLEIFSNIFITEENSRSKSSFENVSNYIVPLGLQSGNAFLNEVKETLEKARANAEFFQDLGLKTDTLKKEKRTIIVVNNLHGIIANLNLVSRKVTKVNKYFNNGGNCDLPAVYYLEEEVKSDGPFYEATPADIFEYKEMYYLKDGSKPFENMTFEEIEKYFGGGKYDY